MSEPRKQVMGPSEAEHGTAGPKERPIPRSDGSAVVARNLGEAWVIVELAPDAIMVIDEQGHIVLANRAAETMFGYDREALVRLGVDALVPQADRQAHRGHRDTYDASPQTRPMGLDLDLKARRADGRSSRSRSVSAPSPSATGLTLWPSSGR